MLERLKKFYSKKEEIVSPASNINTLTREGNDLFSDTLILLDERLSGNLFCTDTVVVEQNGVLSGNLTSKQCVVSGKVTGDIVSADQIDVKSTAVIKGSITCASLNIEPGAVVRGSVTITGDLDLMADLSDRIKEHTEKDLQDQLHPELPKLPPAGEEEPIQLSWEVNSFEKLKEPASEIKEETINELPVEINWTTDVSLITVEDQPDDQPKKEEKKLVAPTSKPEQKEEGNNQRWW